MKFISLFPLYISWLSSWHSSIVVGRFVLYFFFHFVACVAIYIGWCRVEQKRRRKDKSMYPHLPIIILYVYIFILFCIVVVRCVFFFFSFRSPNLIIHLLVVAYIYFLFIGSLVSFTSLAHLIFVRFARK